MLYFSFFNVRPNFETTEGSVSLTFWLLGIVIYWLKSIHSFLVLGLLKTQVTVHQSFDELQEMMLQTQSRETGLGVNVVATVWTDGHTHGCSTCCVCRVFSCFYLRGAPEDPQRRALFSLLLWLLTSQEKRFQTGEACNFNTFYCLWPFMSPICFLRLKQGKIMAMTDFLVRGPQWPCSFGFSWVIWPASFHEMQIRFLHFEHVVARFQEQLMCGIGWHHATAGSSHTSLCTILSYDIRPLSSPQILGIPLCPPPAPPPQSILCL